ncbi:MAG: hypothetical protein IKO36_05985 [Bacteroidaceae bacterium]|nr:hypothetical protein [Bacteroidaceae bacterium]
MEKSLMMLLIEEDEAVKEYNASKNILEQDLQLDFGEMKEEIIKGDTVQMIRDREQMENARQAIRDYFRKLNKI